MNTDRWNRINEIFLAVVDLPVNDQPANLDAECHDDEQLRAEVELLLAGDCDDESFLAPVSEIPGMCALTNDVEDPLLGRRVSHFQIQSLLGSGGMGRVYLATRVEDYFEQVVIKFLRRELGGEEMLRRFRNEMQIQAELGGHPNIARLLDAGATEDGYPFLVMEYVDGVEIDEFCEQHNPSISDRLRLFRVVCATVQFAHQHAVIHRDLKPSNILVTATGEPKLIDFGIAKLLEEDGPEVQTQTAYRALTPHYASPEHLKGKTLTTASDVYSLGVVLYELVTGRRPYRLTSKSAAEVERLVCIQEPTRPSSVIDRDEIAPALHRQLVGDVDNIVLKALRKEPQNRYQSARQLADDIDRHLRGLPIRAQRPTWRYRTSKFVRRNKALVIAASLILLSLVGGIVGTTLQWRRAQNEASSARLATRHAEQNEQVALLQVYRANISLAAAELERGNANAARLWLDACSEGLRNWEWHHFKRRLSLGQIVLAGHTGRVCQSVFLHGGSQLATASWDGTIRIWNVEDGAEITVLRDDMDRIGNLVGSADGRRLATASHDGVLRIWDVDKQSLVTKIATQGGHIAFSSDGSHLACASKIDMRVRVWEASSGTLVAKLPKAPATPGVVVFSPDGTRLAHSSLEGVVLWDVASKSEVFELGDDQSIAHPFAFSPDGHRLLTATGEPDIRVKLWNARTGESIAELSQHSRGIRHASFSADGALVVTASNDSTLKISDGMTGEQIDVLHGHQGPVSWTGFAPDGSLLASCSDDSTVRLWDPSTGRPLRILAGHTGYVHSLNFAPDGRHLASCSIDQSARVWDLGAVEPAVCQGHEGIVMATASSPDNALIASGSLDGTVRLWDIKAAQQVASFRDQRLTSQRETSSSASATHVLCVAYSPDGSSIAAVHRDGRLDVWDVATGERRGNDETGQSVWWRGGVVFTPDSKHVIYQRPDGTLALWNVDDGESDQLGELPPNAVRTMALSPDGNHLALGLADGQAVVWDMQSKREIASFEHEKMVNVVRFSPDGQLLASAGEDASVRVWHLQTNEQVATLPVSATVYALAFSPDGTRLAIGSADEEIQLCDTSAWSIIAQLSGHDADINSLEFTPDGTRLISGSRDRTVRIWSATPSGHRIDVHHRRVQTLANE